MSAFKITKKEILPGSKAIIEGELLIETVAKERNRAISTFQSRINLDGFRKGHVPEKILVDKVGELAIYEEAASYALEHNFGEIIKETGIEAVGSPHVSITKISVGNPVGFKIETAVMPKIELPDYKKIAEELLLVKEETTVEDKDVEKALDDMRRSYAHHEKHHQVDSGKTPEHHDDHTGKDIPDHELPALDDDFAKKLGGFETMEILQEKMKENILNDKKIKAREKLRLSIIENVISKTEISVPDILVDSELGRMLAEFQDNLQRMGIGYDQYLESIKKTDDDIKKEWRSEAEKRAKIQIVLKKIAVEEKIKLDESQVEKEVASILDQYKDVDKTNVESYVRNVLTNEMVWKILEEFK